MKHRPIWLLRTAALLVVPAFFACSHPRSNPAFDSGIRGKAIYGPTCPVQRVGGPSCERPYSGAIAITDSGGVALVVHSDAEGSFSANLRPGKYTISSNGNGLPLVKPFDVVVRPHAYTTITVMFDSGIR
jgi:hypothetical protein